MILNFKKLEKLENYEKLVEELTVNVSKQENQIIEFILRNDGELDFHRI